MLAKWQAVLVCPIDRQPLRAEAERYACPLCGFVASPVTVKDHQVFDFRAKAIPQSVTLTLQSPVEPLDRYKLVQTHFRAPSQKFAFYSGADVKRLFGTKLDKGIQFYCRQIPEMCGPEAPILDLGCGNGGNQRYLRAIGFKNVISVDWNSAGAEMLVDAHRLPFAIGTF